MNTFYERIASLLPKTFLKKFRELLDYADINLDEKRFLGFIFLYTLFLSIGIAVNVSYFTKIPFAFSFIAIFIVLLALVYIWLTIVAENKAKSVEAVLPDALQLIASNIKAGLTTERALFISARPEFGVLSEELKKASKEVLSGERVEVALLEIPKRIRSKILEGTMWLIAKGTTSGGQLADLLMQLSDDLRQQNSMKQEIKASVSLYVLLIFFAATIGAPVLLGITTFITQIMEKQLVEMPPLEGVVSSAASSRLGMVGGFVIGSMEQTRISSVFILNFSYILLFVTAFFASLTIGVINTGRELSGIKIFPVVFLLSFIIFFSIRFVLTLAFGKLVV